MSTYAGAYRDLLSFLSEHQDVPPFIGAMACLSVAAWLLWVERSGRLESAWLRYSAYGYLTFGFSSVVKCIQSNEMVYHLYPRALRGLEAGSSAAAVVAFLAAADELFHNWFLRRLSALGKWRRRMMFIAASTVAGVVVVSEPALRPMASAAASVLLLPFALSLVSNLGLHKRPFNAMLPIAIWVINMAIRIWDMASCWGLSPGETAPPYKSVVVGALSTTTALLYTWPITVIVYQMFTEILPKRQTDILDDDIGTDLLERMLREVRSNLDADRAEVFCLMPDRAQHDVRRILVTAGTRPAVDGRQPPPSQGSAASRALSGETVREWSSPVDQAIRKAANLDTSFPSIVAVPIRAGDVVLAALVVAWKAPHAFTNVTVRRIEQMTCLLLPAIQSYREIAAIDHCHRRLQEPLLEETTNGTGRDLDDEIAAICDIVKTSLDLAKVEIRLDVQLKTKPRQPTSNAPSARSARTPTSDRWLIPLRAGAYRIGEMTLASKHRNAASAVVYSRAVRDAVATTVAGAMLGRLRWYQALALSRAQAALLDADSYAGWFTAIEHAAQSAGFLWVVCPPLPGNPSWLGQPNHIALVEAIAHIVPLGSSAPYKTRATQDTPSALSLHTAPNGATVLALPLSAIGICLWLGARKELFGAEPDAASPWGDFLTHLAEIAATAYTRLHARYELERVQFGLNQAYAQATIAAANRTVVHQVRNSITTLVLGINQINDEVQRGAIAVDVSTASFILGLQKSGEALSDLVGKLDSAMDNGEERPVDVIRAAEQSRDIFAVALRQAEIELSIVAMPPDMEIFADVSARVVFLAIANLVDNAREAIVKTGRNDGRIDVYVRQEASCVSVEVKDNGGGIPEALKPWIFDLGTTSRTGSGGWGLFLVKRAMRENGGNVVLVRTGQSGTCFRLEFPGPYSVLIGDRGGES